jgi:hypothetical protein
VSFNAKNLTMADRLVGGGAILFLLVSFLPWYSATYNFGFGISGTESAIGLQSGAVVLALLLFLAAAVWATLPALTDVAVPFPRGFATVGLCLLALLFTLIAWLGTFEDFYDFSLWGLVGFLVALAVTAVAVLGLLPQLGRAVPGPLAGAARWAGKSAPQSPPGHEQPLAPGGPVGPGPGYGQPGQAPGPWTQPAPGQQGWGQPLPDQSGPGQPSWGQQAPGPEGWGQQAPGPQAPGPHGWAQQTPGPQGWGQQAPDWGQPDPGRPAAEGPGNGSPPPSTGSTATGRPDPGSEQERRPPAG